MMEYPLYSIKQIINLDWIIHIVYQKMAIFAIKVMDQTAINRLDNSALWVQLTELVYKMALNV